MNDTEREQASADFHEHLHIALNVARDLNREGEASRSRELSLVVTKLEEADHWWHAERTVAGGRR